MNAETIESYQQLVDSVTELIDEDYESFKLTANHDEIGYGMALEFNTKLKREVEITPVPLIIFDIVERIRDAAGPDLAWSEWIFDFNRDGKYNIQVKYPDGSAT